MKENLKKIGIKTVKGVGKAVAMVAGIVVICKLEEMSKKREYTSIDDEDIEYERELESQSIDDMGRSLYGEGNYSISRIYTEEDYFDLETGLTNDIVEEIGEIFENSEDFENYKNKLRQNPELQLDLLNDYYSYEEYDE